MKHNILIGGSAGHGMDTISSIIQKILQRKGYYVFSNKDYMSRVRGGHNFIQIRFGNEPITSHDPNLDVIIALDEDTINFHQKRLNKDGLIISNGDDFEINNNIIRLPMIKIGKEVGNPKVFGSVAVGAILKIFGLSKDNIDAVFKGRFSKEIGESNLIALNRGYEIVKTYFNMEGSEQKNNILISGNQAIGLGALAGGLSFYSAYPMTPSTSIMTFLSKRQREAGIIVEQAEDEIASINMAIGASYAGVRAMTGTSGGGFSLMVEGLGLTAIMEVPLVVVNVQRPGPATGLSTRTAQGDLSFLLTASQDEFPRMIVSVRNPEDAFYQTARALNLSEKYQMLVMILSDQYLSDYTQTVPEFDFDRITIERYIDNNEEGQSGRHKRYKFTDTGISPRLIPGNNEGITVLADSHEHNEYGYVDESDENRIAMMNKRMKRMELLKDELIEPDFFGVEKPDVLLLSWGSTYGSIKEATDLLVEDGYSIGTLVFGDLFPLPTIRLEKYASLAKTIVNVEHNYTGQLAKLIRQETGIKCNKNILRYDGRQLSSHDIYDRVKKEVL